MVHEGGLVGGGQLAGDQLRLGHGGQAHGRLLRQDVPLAAGAGAMKRHRIALLGGHMVHGHTIGGAVTVAVSYTHLRRHRQEKGVLIKLKKEKGPLGLSFFAFNYPTPWRGRCV